MACSQLLVAVFLFLGVTNIYSAAVADVDVVLDLADPILQPELKVDISVVKIPAPIFQCQYFCVCSRRDPFTGVTAFYCDLSRYQCCQNANTYFQWCLWSGRPKYVCYSHLYQALCACKDCPCQ